jgi:hypothetical protein
MQAETKDKRLKMETFVAGCKLQGASWQGPENAVI